MEKNHHIIVIPGLGGSTPLFQTVVNYWMRNNIQTEVFDMMWRDAQTDFSTRLNDLIRRIDQLHTTGKTISLVGTSAGGSAVINAFYQRTDKIHRVVNVCGRLSKGTNVFPSLEVAARTSPSFLESVLTCERNCRSLSSSQRERILTITPFFDEIVPVSTMQIPGSRLMKIWSFEHLLSITLAMTIHAHRLVEFLKEDE